MRTSSLSRLINAAKFPQCTYDMPSVSPISVDDELPLSLAGSCKSTASNEGDKFRFSTIAMAGSPTPPSILSMALSELDAVLAIDDREFKGVQFGLFSPVVCQYTVSNNVDPNHLRRPGPLFPKSLPQSTTIQELVECSETLQAAISCHTVHSEDDEYYHWDYHEDPVHDSKPDLNQYFNGKSHGNADGKSDGKSDGNLNSKSVEKTGSNCKSKDEALSVTSPRTEQFIDLYIAQNMYTNPSVHFDKISVTKCNEKTVLLSSKGLSNGIHEFSIEILKCDVDLMEIGVIGTNDIDRIPVSDYGAVDTARFKSRAVYGSALTDGTLFYGSLNADGSHRCMRDLRPFFKRGWPVGSLITVKLDLNLGRIKFLLNGQSVRYTMSLEPNKEYFPMICFSGNCKYFHR